MQTENIMISFGSHEQTFNRWRKKKRYPHIDNQEILICATVLSEKEEVGNQATVEKKIDEFSCYLQGMLNVGIRVT